MAPIAPILDRLANRLSPSPHRDLRRERVRRDERDSIAAPEPPRVIPARRSRPAEQTHVLVGRGDKLSADDRLQRGRPAQPPPEPPPQQPETAGKRTAVKAVDDLHQPVLVVAVDRALELAHPGALLVARVPRRDGLGEQVKLHASVPLTGPY